MVECSCSNLSNPAHFKKAILAQKWKQATSEPQFQLKYHGWQPLLTQLQNQDTNYFQAVLKRIKIVK